jgi:hypothetical protein
LEGEEEATERGHRGEEEEGEEEEEGREGEVDEEEEEEDEEEEEEEGDKGRDKERGEGTNMFGAHTLCICEAVAEDRSRPAVATPVVTYCTTSATATSNSSSDDAIASGEETAAR